jgi:hypothetical protein
MLGSSVAGVLPYISTKAAKSEAEGATVRTRLIFPTVVLILMVALSPATRGQSSTSLPSPTPDISGVWLLEKYQPALFPVTTGEKDNSQLEVEPNQEGCPTSFIMQERGEISGICDEQPNPTEQYAQPDSEKEDGGEG